MNSSSRQTTLRRQNRPVKASRPAESPIPVGGGNAACAAANVAIATNIAIAALAAEAGAAAFCAASCAADALTADKATLLSQVVPLRASASHLFSDGDKQLKKQLKEWPGAVAAPPVVLSVCSYRAGPKLQT